MVRCPICWEPMRPEHAHHRCDTCGHLEPCCDGEPQREES
jgi:hypothetical protein